MKIHSSLFLLGTLGVLTGGPAFAAADTSQWQCQTCPYPKAVSGNVEAGLGSLSEASARFGNHTGLQTKGGHLVLGGEATLRGGGGLFADLSAADLGLDTRSMQARGGREGLFTLTLDYAEIPSHFGDGARSPFLGIGGADLTLPGGYPQPLTALMPAASLQPVELGYKHRRLGVGGRGPVADGWSWRFNVRHDVRDGTRPTYASFFSTAAQMAAPVDQVTDQIEVSGSYYSRNLQATLGYQVSQFRNGPDALTWTNPFSPVAAGSTRGQLALAPDNQFHQVVGSAGYEITPTIRASADFALGRMAQDATYLVSTLTPSLAARVPALPAASLDGRVDTFSGNLRLTAALFDGLRLNASYSRNVRDNQTGRLAYPEVATDIFVRPSSVANTPFDFTQDRFRLGADYRGPASLKFSAGVEQDNRERSFHEAVQTRETTVWGRVGVTAGEIATLSLKLSHGDRDHSSYGISTWLSSPDNPLQRKFNLAARQRDSASLRADIALGEGVNLGLDADVAIDDYSKSVIGLTRSRSSGAGADLAAALSDETSVHAYVRSDWVQSRQTGSEAFARPDWTANTRDVSELLGLGVRHAAMENKLNLGADVVLVRTRSTIGFDTLVAIAGQAFPTATTATDTLKLFATYRLSETMAVTGSFWHERYRSQDWRLDGVQPFALPDLLSLGLQSPQYRVNVFRVSLRYGF